MRLALTATVAAAVALVAAGVLGVAVAEGPSSSPPRTVSVQGVAMESIDRSASASVATAVYRRGMTDAISDGASKAQFLASKAGANLGAVQSIVEDGGYISCVGETEYLGEQPDFGSPGVSLPGASVRAAPQVRKLATRRRHHNTPAAKKANVSTCTLSTEVSLAYLLS
jgi:hypothetical protein